VGFDATNFLPSRLLTYDDFQCNEPSAVTAADL